MKTAEAELIDIVGAANLFAGDAIDERFRTDMFGNYRSSPGWVLRAGSTEDVAAVMRVASRHRLPVTTMGGRTGIVGGVASAPGGILLTLERMNRVLNIDTREMTVTVEAGTILQTLQERLEEQDVMLPLDLGSRGSATIGGTIATNAGGNRVLRWGSTRDSVIGLEAVLADGAVLSSLKPMLKNAAGYDWKHLLIGSEGTLGIVTKAVLRLRPLVTAAQTALVALDGFDNAITLFRSLERELGGQLSSFELMWRNFYEAVTTAQIASRPLPLPHGHAVYAVVESLGNHAEREAVIFEEALMAAIENGVVEDVVIARSERERTNLWAAREDLGPIAMQYRPVWGFDISMALADMPQVIERSEAQIRKDFPDALVLHYGHAGDGNLHAIVSVAGGGGDAELAVERAIYGAVRDVGGSISAEHGIGQAKLDFLSYSRSPAEIALMRTLKRAIDPGSLLNPGKILRMTATDGGNA